MLEIEYHRAIDYLVGEARRPADRPDNGTADTVAAAALGGIEACSGTHRKLVANVAAHPFIEALFLAILDHRPLCLSPDMIWLLICQGVAQHVNVNAERLRSRFVQHEETVEIQVRRHDFIKGSPGNPWGEVIHEFSSRVREHIGPAHALFVPQFSTTGPVERIAAEIVLLDAMQSYFEYSVNSICGIPTITLEGTVQDWQDLAHRAQAFAEFDLGWWLTPLQPVLQEFVAAARGEVRPAFWQSIYKYGGYSGGASITGWSIALFPYLKDQHGKPSRKNPWVARSARLQTLMAGDWYEGRLRMGGPSMGAIPSGLARAPFTWEFPTRRFDMEFLGGFVGVAQDSSALTLRPEIGWAIGEVPVSR